MKVFISISFLFIFILASSCTAIKKGSFNKRKHLDLRQKQVFRPVEKEKAEDSLKLEISPTTDSIITKSGKVVCANIIKERFDYSFVLVQKNDSSQERFEIHTSTIDTIIYDNRVFIDGVAEEVDPTEMTETEARGRLGRSRKMGIWGIVFLLAGPIFLTIYWVRAKEAVDETNSQTASGCFSSAIVGLTASVTALILYGFGIAVTIGVLAAIITFLLVSLAIKNRVKEKTKNS